MFKKIFLVSFAIINIALSQSLSQEEQVPQRTHSLVWGKQTPRGQVTILQAPFL